MMNISLVWPHCHANLSSRSDEMSRMTRQHSHPLLATQQFAAPGALKAGSKPATRQNVARTSTRGKPMMQRRRTVLLKAPEKSNPICAHLSATRLCRPQFPTNRSVLRPNSSSCTTLGRKSPHAELEAAEAVDAGESCACRTEPDRSPPAGNRAKLT